MHFFQIFQDITSNENMFGHLAYILAIVSMLMRNIRWLRIFAILSGLVAIVYFGFVRGDFVSSLWEFLYVAVNVVQLFLLWYENRMSQFDGVERDFVSHALMNLRPVHAAKMVRAARLETIEAGQVMVTQGRVPERLYYIVSGDVRIEQDGVPVGHCAKGDFLGEMSLLSQSGANATAIAAATCEVLSFDRARIEHLTGKVEPLRHALHAGISRNLLEKIGRMNAFSVNMQTNGAV